MENWEIDCVEQAGKIGGEYLEHLNRFDLKSLSKLEWIGFLTSLCEEYHRLHIIRQSELSPQRQDVP